MTVRMNKSSLTKIIIIYESIRINYQTLKINSDKKDLISSKLNEMIQSNEVFI